MSLLLLDAPSVRDVLKNKRGKKEKKKKGKRAENDEEVTSRPVVDTTTGELPDVRTSILLVYY